MTALIFRGETYHKRFKPVKHAFVYKLFFLGLPIDKLQDICSKTKLLSYNSWSLLSIHDQDYFRNQNGTLFEKANSTLEHHGIYSIDQVYLYTTPRFLGYVFNPVNFYCCFKAGVLNSLICEVNNTFRESQLYVLKQKDDSPNIFRFPKEFYVSPFFGVEGEYEVRFNQQDLSIKIEVDLLNDGELLLATSLQGFGKSLNDSELIKVLFQYPLTVLLTMLRIHFQAFKLYFLKKLRFYYKPKVKESFNQYGKPGIIERFRAFVISKTDCIR